MKINFEAYNLENVTLKTVAGDTIQGKLFLHHMNYPKRIILEINGKYLEEFQIINIKRMIKD